MENITLPALLAFDRVMEGTAIKAQNSPLFKIPIEILGNIIRHLCNSRVNLASLALVNSDCRQIARSCQFRTVLLDRSHGSARLLGILQREAVQRHQNQGRTQSLSLGACIRRVVVRNDGYWNELIASRPRKPGRSIHDLHDDAYDNDEEKVAQWREFASGLTHQLNEIYKPNVLFVISGLIHLESFDLDQVDWNQSLLNSLTACTVKHLSIRDLKMTDIIPVIDESVIWPLESLCVRFSWDYEFLGRVHNYPLNASKSWETLFRLCSGYLHVLNLTHCLIVGVEVQEDPVSFSLKFPQLRHLYLPEGSYLGKSAIESLILTSPHLNTMVIDYGIQEIRDILDRQGQIYSLKTLILDHGFQGIPDNVSLDFLKNNPQIEAVGLTREEPATLLKRILLLLRKFSLLKKLTMVWMGSEIPDSSFDTLSTLASLEKLHLSCGLQIGQRHDWLISHDNILKRLKPLSNLKYIALTRDGYSYVFQGQPQEYTSYQLLRSYSWQTHNNFMRATARKYARTFPKLEFLHMGNLSFGIHRENTSIFLKVAEEEFFSWEKRIFELRY